MKVLKFSRWFFLVLGILFIGLLGFLVFTDSSDKEMMAVGNITEDIICDILFVAIPFAFGLAALFALIVIIKRGYGDKLFLIASSVMFIGLAVLVFLGRGISTDRIIRNLESSDGQYKLYYVQEYSERTRNEWMRVYRRTGAFTYEELFSVDNDKTDLIKWGNDGVRFDNEKFDYSSYTAK